MRRAILRMRINFLYILFCVNIFTSMAIAEQNTSTILDSVQNAHGLSAWWNTKALSADVKVVFGEKVSVDGIMIFETNGPRARLQLKNGALAVFDGKTCWVRSEKDAFPRARFHVLTWSWFTMAPFKLNGKGIHIEPFKKVEWSSGSYYAALQTFGENIGDTPEDWYYPFVSPSTWILQGMGYIVTYGKERKKADEHPGAILYSEYQKIKGCNIATHWKFVHFDKKQGFEGEKGWGELKNLQFVDNADSLFIRPDGSVEEKLP